MKYTVSVNEKSKTITVDLNGYKGVAKCCETDQFNLATGIELALERAKVAKAEAEKPKSAITKSGDVMELVKALEKALPKGQIVLVGNGEGLTEKHKEWLLSLCGCPKSNAPIYNNGSEGRYYSDDEIEEIKSEAYDEGYIDGQDDIDDRYDEGYDDGHADGYDSGYSDAAEEYESDTSAEDLADRIREVLAECLE